MTYNDQNSKVYINYNIIFRAKLDIAKVCIEFDKVLPTEPSTCVVALVWWKINNYKFNYLKYPIVWGELS